MSVLFGFLMRWLVPLTITLLLPVISTPDWPAPPPQLAGEWDVTLQVRASKVQVIWTGRVWDYAVGDGVIVDTRRVDITADCQRFGGPVVGENDITFDGFDDYIDCDLPDYAQIFEEMAPELAECRCFYGSPPYAAADITPVLLPIVRPIVYHGRLRLEVMADPGPGDGWSLFTLQFNSKPEQQWQSNIFPVPQRNGLQLWAGFDAARFTANTRQAGWAEFLEASGLWDAVKPAYADGILLWESEATSMFSAEALPAGFALGPGTTLYFGYNPDTSAYFAGKMRTVAVDPGCRAHSVVQ